MFPEKHLRKLERSLTIPRTTTLLSKHSPQPEVRKVEKVPWLKFDGLVVGRNSLFHTDRLTNEQLEEIGGVEYRALRVLSYIIPFVCFLVIL